jgi:hypothetical protein
MELQQALAQIGDIRLQMSRTRLFRGYRAGTALLTGVAAAGAALWQARNLPDAAAEPMRFVNLWVTVGIACAFVVGIEMALRWRRSPSSLQRELTVRAIEQLLPGMIVGALITVVFCDFGRPAPWVLPGLWQILFGLGIVASRRLLAPPVLAAGAFYVLAGLFNLILAQSGNAFSPWAMGAPFAIGQTAIAFILHRGQERFHGE